MTFSPAQRLLAAICFILLVGCAALGYLYLSARSQKTELEASLATLQTTVNRLNLSLESPNASDPLLRTPAFPRDPPDLSLVSAVLASAAESGVSTGPVQTMQGSSEQIGTSTYRTTVLNLTIGGTLPQILNFFDRMERAGIRTLAFDNIRLEPANGQWTAQMQIIVYAQHQ